MAEIRRLDGRGKQSSHYLSPRGMGNDNEGLTKSAVDSFEYIYQRHSYLFPNRENAAFEVM